MNAITLDGKLGQVKLVLMDIDGTLITGDSDSIENVVRQLRRLRQVGIKFSVATGRTLFGARKIIEKFMGVRAQLPPIIAYNGGIVAWPEDSDVISRRTLGGEAYRSVVRECRNRGLTALVYLCRDRWDRSPMEEVYGSDVEVGCQSETEFNGMPINWVSDLELLDSEDVVALLAFDPAKRRDSRSVADGIREKLGHQVRITTSSGVYLEIAHHECTKLSAIRILTGPLKVLPKEIMAIGDSFNDIELIRGAGVGIAVGNAPDEVKSKADYVCQLKGSMGVVEALRRLLAVARHNRVRRRIKEDRERE